jgi:DNA-binding CsgD family transcriptional regulator
MHSRERAPLSTRQAEIAALVSRGKSTREIAEAFNLSPRTVEAHVVAIFNKLGVRSRHELAAKLLEPAAPLRALDAVPNNLPRQLTSFVGRRAEIAEIIALIELKQLVTIVGSAGVGKTRTSLEVARGLLSRFNDGVWFIELAAHGRRLHSRRRRASTRLYANGRWGSADKYRQSARDQARASDL